jgi:hypothetical protein
VSIPGQGNTAQVDGVLVRDMASRGSARLFITKACGVSMRPIHTLVVLPPAFVLLGPFFLNRVTPFVLGMPFLLAWLAGTLVITSIVMALVYRSDSKHRIKTSEEMAGDHA